MVLHVPGLDELSTEEAGAAVFEELRRTGHQVELEKRGARVRPALKRTDPLRAWVYELGVYLRLKCSRVLGHVAAGPVPCVLGRVVVHRLCARVGEEGWRARRAWLARTEQERRRMSARRRVARVARERSPEEIVRRQTIEAAARTVVDMTLACGGAVSTAYRVAAELAYGLEDPQERPGRWNR